MKVLVIIYFVLGFIVGRLFESSADKGPIFFLIVAFTWPIWAGWWLYYFIKYWREND